MTKKTLCRDPHPHAHGYTCSLRHMHLLNGDPHSARGQMTRSHKEWVSVDEFKATTRELVEEVASLRETKFNLHIKLGEAERNLVDANDHRDPMELPSIEEPADA